jgi:peptidoglycan/LPS O-acetylase OafA/YrhL
LTPFFQKILGYTEYVNPIYLWGQQIKTVPVKTQTSIFNHWIVDGWFPIFPWLGFSLLGVNFAHHRWKDRTSDTFGKKSILLLGLVILTLGSVIWWLYPGSLLTREEASELFYPPTVGYIITTIGLILTLFYIVDRKPSLFIYKPLRALGESSLFMYMIHIPLIEYVISPIWSKQNVQAFLLIYIGLSVFLILVAYGLRVLKAKWNKRPFIIRFLLGG